MDKRNLQILLVDDNEINLKVASGFLRHLGYGVTTAGNGVEALRCHDNQPADIIFMDISMPGMDGYETTAMIRAAEKSGELRVPIIALTAFSSDDVRDRCRDAGMDGFLTKPVMFSDLETTIEEVRLLHCPAE